MLVTPNSEPSHQAIDEPSSNMELSSKQLIPTSSLVTQATADDSRTSLDYSDAGSSRYNDSLTLLQEDDDTCNEDLDSSYVVRWRRESTARPTGRGVSFNDLVQVRQVPRIAEEDLAKLFYDEVDLDGFRADVFFEELEIENDSNTSDD